MSEVWYDNWIQLGIPLYSWFILWSKSLVASIELEENVKWTWRPWKLVLMLFLIMYFDLFPPASTLTSCDTDKLKPTILVKTRQGEKVLLPCHTASGVDIKSVKWFKNELPVASSDGSIENNFRLHENSTLEINQVALDDDGNYTCQVMRVEPWKPIIQMITVQVLCKYLGIKCI